MRIIGFFIFALLLWSSSLLREMGGNKITSASSKQAFFRFHPTVNLYSSLLSHTKKRADIDNNTLKQSNWYAGVIKNIRESEYEIKPGATKNFAAPNLEQDLKT